MEDQKKMTHARTEENWVPLEPASDKNGQIRLKFSWTRYYDDKD